MMTQESFAGGASLLTVPFVVRSKILCTLNLREQLSLRLVCRTTRDWIDFSTVTDHVPITVIRDFGSKTLTRFLEKRPPHVITSIYIENETYEFLDDPALDYFHRLYSDSVTFLRVKRFFPCESQRELAFYESFVNVSELELEKISIPSERDVEHVYPANFKALKVLKIGCVKAFPEPPDDLFAAALIPFARQRPMGLYAWDLVRFCEEIEFLGYPKTSKYFFQAFVDGRGRGEFGVFCDYIRQRQLQSPHRPNLRICDFENEHWSPDARNALALLKMGIEFGVKYLNMNANQFQYVRISSLVRMYDLPSSTGDCILSFKNFNCLVTECLPAVEKITLSASEVNSMLDYSCIFNGPRQFPNLKQIEIVVDTGFSAEAEMDIYRRAREFKDVRSLLSHFFYDTEMILCDEDENIQKYTSVTSLSIRFPGGLGYGMSKARPEDLPLDWIVKGVPSLERLELVGWSAKGHETFWKLWRELPHLRQLVLEDCEGLTQTCFDGCPDLSRVSIKSPKVIDESIREFFEDARGMQHSDFLSQASSMNSSTWIKC